MRERQQRAHAREIPEFGPCAGRNVQDHPREERSRLLILEDFVVNTAVSHDEHVCEHPRVVARVRAGGIRLSEKKIARAVRARSAEMDLVVLLSMLSWANSLYESVCCIRPLA
jgi:hypothetical protein